MNTAQKYEKIEKAQPASHTGRSRINSERPVCNKKGS